MEHRSQLSNSTSKHFLISTVETLNNTISWIVQFSTILIFRSYVRICPKMNKINQSEAIYDGHNFYFGIFLNENIIANFK